MWSKVVILLAVFSNLIEAGPIRQHGRLIQRNQAPRFINGSAIASNLDDIQSSTPITISSTSSSATTDVLTYSTLSALDQSSSTATFDDSSSSTTLDTVSTPATQTTAVSMTSNSNAQYTSSFVAPPVVENGESQAQSSGGTYSEFSHSQPATSTRATNGLDNAIATASTSLASTSLASTAPLVEIPATNTYQFAAVTVASKTSGAPRTSSTVQYPNAQNGNAAMASGFNQIYQTLSETSSCDAEDTNQAFSCISGELAQCQSDGTYVLKSCPQGQSCYALPLPSGQTGISVECAVPGNAASRLAAQPSATSLTVSAVSQPSSTVQDLATQNSQSVQGGYVAGGLNTPMTTSVQQQAQTTASLPSAEAESNSPVESAVSQTSATTPSARTASQTSAPSTTLQKAVPVTTASQAGNVEAPKQSSASQAATEAPATTASHIPSANPVDQFPTSQVTTVMKPVEQSSTSQNTMEISPTTAAYQVKNTKSENQLSVKVTTTNQPSPTTRSGPLFSVLTPNPSSIPAEQDHLPEPTATSILALPAAAQDIPETTPTTGAHPEGVTIVPMTPPTAANNDNNNNNNPGNNNAHGINNSGGNNVVDEKVVANSVGYSPIYITVTATVTTTAYDPVATA